VPSSMIFLGLVVLWLLILVPAVARHRQEVARPSTAALSARVLDRPGPAAERGPVARPGTSRAGEGTRSGGGRDRARGAAAAVRGRGRRRRGRRPTPTTGTGQRPPPKYRRGRGGFDPEAAALAARARYAFRQRVVLAMLVVAVATAVVAALVVPWVWWLHAPWTPPRRLPRPTCADRCVWRSRSGAAAARMAGTRRTSAAEDPDARRVGPTRPRGRFRAGSRHHDDDHAGRRPTTRPTSTTAPTGTTARRTRLRRRLPTSWTTDPPHPSAKDGDEDADGDDADELARETPERIAGDGPRCGGVPAPGLDMMEVETALPRCSRSPRPAAGRDVAGRDRPGRPRAARARTDPAAPDYRRAVGE
jgi:hypothetical protein